MQYVVAEKDAMLEVSIYGTVTRSDILALWRELEQHHEARQACVRVVEPTWETSGKDIEKLATSTKRLPRLRWALIGKDDRSFGTLRMFASWASTSDDVGVFREKSAALNWLQGPPVN